SDEPANEQTTSINIPAPVATLKTEAEAVPAVIPPGDWYYAVGTNRAGPVSGHAIVDKVKSRELDENSKLWTEGLAKWILLKNSAFRVHLPKPTGPPLLEEVDETWVLPQPSPSKAASEKNAGTHPAAAMTPT